MDKMDKNSQGHDKRIFLTSLEDVWEEELEVLRRRRKRIRECKVGNKKAAEAKGDVADPFYTAVGLSLSGGGIRSALFNLGILQGLSRQGVLRLVDILSTVSGGGYIGGCLSALLSIKDPRERKELQGEEVFRFKMCDKPLFSTTWQNFPLRDSKRKRAYCENEQDAKPFHGENEQPSLWASHFSAKDEMRHLRNRSNYLLPGGSNFMTMFKSAGALGLNFLGPFLWFTGFIILTTTLYMGLISWYFSLAHVSLSLSSNNYTHILQEMGELFGSFCSWINIDRFIWFLLIPLLFFLITVFWGSRPIVKSEKLELQFIPRRLKIVLSINMLLLLLMVLPLAMCFKYQYAAFMVAPAFTIFLDIWLIFFHYGVVSKDSSDDFSTSRRRSLLYLRAGIFFMLFLYSLFLALLPFLIKSVSGMVMPLLQIIVGIGIKFLLDMDTKVTEPQTMLARYLASFKDTALNLAVFLFVLLFVLVIGRFADWYVWEGLWLQWPLFHEMHFARFFSVLGVGALLFWGMPIFNFNRISNHYFYRDCLSEAFLMTAVMDNKGEDTWKSNEDEAACIVRNLIQMKMTKLHGINACSHSSESDADSVAAMGPYHIINATLNLTASHDLKGLRRKTEPFIFSRLFTGSDRTGYIKTDRAYPGLTLARAITTSGAAVAPIMGMMTTRIRSFACTILGVRLGLWLRNPRCLAKELLKKDDKNETCPSFDGTIHDKDKIRYWMVPLLRELTGAVGDNKEIYISDGGHSGDNLGIVPLLKRRVKLVIASDAECDKDFLFNSLNNSLRTIFVDEGIKADMTLGYDLFKKNDQGLVKTHYMIGRILYPDRPWQASWLLVMKSSLIGHELTPILNYKKKSPDFPHETTANQFFSEEQFEMYRALGRHIAYYVMDDARKIEVLQGQDPWSGVDALCRALVEKLKKMSGVKSSKSEMQHPWDDIFHALWDCERVDFFSWKAFRKDIAEMAKDAKRANFTDTLICTLLKLHKWLEKNIKCFKQDGRRDFITILENYDIPRSIKEFQLLQKRLSLKEPRLFYIELDNDRYLSRHAKLVMKRKDC